jgi:DNA mismatch repair protein MLH1
MRPNPIVRLSPDVVNRVAAGEVIHRPASALKEMLENSLDAGSRSITVTVRDGGNKLLQVTDDGCGIRDEDMSILCERHTTSKLRTFEDLDAVATFGFRGEALASMSFVANLTVTTMTAGAAHATRAAYADGKMTPEGPRPTAGVPGTTVCVENLFYNVPTRRRALRSASEEYARVLETTQRYAASRPDVAFTVRKLGDARPALRCPSVCAVDDTRMTNGNGTPAGVARNPRVDRLRAIYGDTTARCLATPWTSTCTPRSARCGFCIRTRSSSRWRHASRRSWRRSTRRVRFDARSD